MRPARRILGLGALGVWAILSLSPHVAVAGADSTAASHDAGVVDVVEVTGFLDGIMVDFVERSIRKAESDGSLGLVLQVDSSRATIDNNRLAQLASSIRNSRVSISMWVGPSGAVATGGVGQLAGVVTDLALAPGSRLGSLGDPLLAPEFLAQPFVDAYQRMRHRTISSDEAIALGLAREAPTLPFFVLDLDGFRSEIDTSGDEPVRVPESSVRFAKLSVFDGFMHAGASPAVAYLAFLVGVGLLVFEFYTAGVGIAGVVGALSLLLGCYGLATLPVRGWAVALLLLAMFGYAVDIQTGVPRVWTAIATLCLIGGSLTLFEGLSLSWVTLLAGIAGVFVGMVAGMPAMVRARFGTPTSGREWMIGAAGVVRDDVDPDGVVLIDEAPWRAHTHRNTPIDAGERVRVVSIEGLFLMVEPDPSTTDVDAAKAPVGAVPIPSDGGSI